MIESTLHEQGEGHRLDLTGELTIYHAHEIKQALLDAVAQCRALELNLADVSEMDSAGVQLLCLARREADATGRTLRVVGHGEASREVFDTLELDRFFGDATLLPAAHDDGVPAS